MHEFKFIILAFAALIFLNDCNNAYHQLPADKVLPPVSPGSVFTGTYSGLRILTDRAGTIKGSAVINRECIRNAESLSGTCKDSTVWNGNEKSDTVTEWSAVFLDDNEAVWTISETDSANRIINTMSGKNHTGRALLILKGSGTVPFSSDITMNTVTRFAQLPGEAGFLHQKTDYFMYGIRMGSSETFWRK